MRIRHYFLSVLLLLWVFAVPMEGLGQSKLQQYLDSLANIQSVKTRATPPVKYQVIDLSEFDSDITEPLYVRNHINVMFVNGQLIRKFEGNLIVVQDGSSLVIGEGVQLLSQSIQSNYLVLVNGGKLIVQDGVVNPCSLDGSTVTANGCIYSGMRAISLKNPTDELELDGGEIICDVAAGEGTVVCKKGTCGELTAQNVILDMEDKLSLKVYVRDRVYIRNKILNQLTIHCSKTYGSVIAQGDKEYLLTNDDLDSISVVSTIKAGLTTTDNFKGWNYSTKLENNQIYLCEDPIIDAKTLQARLDEIAFEFKTLVHQPHERVTVVIPSSGIEIGEAIVFKKNCRVKLTGGPIKISSKFNFPITATITYPFYAFLTEAESAVEFENITLDFNHNNVFKMALFEIYGMFAIKDNVEFKNIDKDIDLKYGVFYMHDGCHFTYGGYSEINVNPTVFYGEGVQEAYFTGFAESYSNPVVNTQSIFNITGGKIQSNYAPYSIKCKYLHIGGGTYITSVSETVAEADEIYIDGGYINGKTLEAEKITITQDGSFNHHFSLNKIAVKKSLTLYGSLNIECPVSFENPDSRISINQAIKCSAKIKFISPCWKDLLSKQLISGTSYYALQDDILDNFDFSESKYKPVLDKTNNCIYLKKKSLNEALDDLGGDKGTEEDPVDIDLPDEEEVAEDTHFPGGLQGFLDGLSGNEGDGENPKVIKLGGGNIFVDPGCTISIRNYILDGCLSGKRIYVDGTLVIDINVYIRYFSDYFIYVRKGGRVIWRGGRTELIDKVIYNNGGTIILEGGEIKADNGSAIVNIGGTIEVNEGDNGLATTIIGSIQNGDNGYGGVIRFYAGVYHGHIINHGTLVISGGYFNYNHAESSPTTITNYGELSIEGGTVVGYIYSFTDLRLCGCATVWDIYLRGGSKVYITERIKEKLRINVFIEGDINNGTAIVVGFGGYVLTEDDIRSIELVLPNGYEWEYDNTLHAIIIKLITGIDNVETDTNSSTSSVYTLSGVKVGKTTDKNIPKGVYVIDGKKILLNSEK